MKFIDFEKLTALFLKYWDKFLIDGVEYTLALAAITVAFGTVFASVLALMKMSKIPPLRWLSAIYIEIIRGTPTRRTRKDCRRKRRRPHCPCCCSSTSSISVCPC